jgi:uncharacterized membrane protein
MAVATDSSVAKRAQMIVVVSFAALAALALCWELWIAPLRPGGSWLALKALPLALALPGLWRGRIRSYQWWSLGLSVYLSEAVVRAMGDARPSAGLALAQAILCVVAFAGILVFVRAQRAHPKTQAAPAH